MTGGGHIWFGNYVISGGVAGKHLGDLIFHVQVPNDKNIMRNLPNTIL